MTGEKRALVQRYLEERLGQPLPPLGSHEFNLTFSRLASERPEVLAWFKEAVLEATGRGAVVDKEVSHLETPVAPVATPLPERKPEELVETANVHSASTPSEALSDSPEPLQPESSSSQSNKVPLQKGKSPFFRGRGKETKSKAAQRTATRSFAKQVESKQRAENLFRKLFYIYDENIKTFFPHNKKILSAILSVVLVFGSVWAFWPSIKAWMNSVKAPSVGPISAEIETPPPPSRESPPTQPQGEAQSPSQEQNTEMPPPFPTAEEAQPPTQPSDNQAQETPQQPPASAEQSQQNPSQQNLPAPPTANVPPPPPELPVYGEPIPSPQGGASPGQPAQPTAVIQKFDQSAGKPVVQTQQAPAEKTGAAVFNAVYAPDVSKTSSKPVVYTGISANNNGAGENVNSGGNSGSNSGGRVYVSKMPEEGSKGAIIYNPSTGGGQSSTNPGTPIFISTPSKPNRQVLKPAEENDGFIPNSNLSIQSSSSSGQEDVAKNAAPEKPSSGAGAQAQIRQSVTSPTPLPVPANLERAVTSTPTQNSSNTNSSPIASTTSNKSPTQTSTTSETGAGKGGTTKEKLVDIPYGAILKGRVVSGLVFSKDNPQLPILVKANLPDGSHAVFFGVASLNPRTGRVVAQFDRMYVDNVAYVISGYLVDSKNTLGLSGQAEEVAPNAAVDLLRGAFSGLKSYVDYYAKSTQTTILPNSGVVTSSAPPPLGLTILSGALGQFAAPPDETSLVRVWKIPADTEVGVIVVPPGAINPSGN